MSENLFKQCDDIGYIDQFFNRFPKHESKSRLFEIGVPIFEMMEYGIINRNNTIFVKPEQYSVYESPGCGCCLVLPNLDVKSKLHIIPEIKLSTLSENFIVSSENLQRKYLRINNGKFIKHFKISNNAFSRRT